MFDRVGHLAERIATHVSRRAFLGRLGQGALGLVAVIGGVLAFPAQAKADGGCCFGTNWATGECYYYASVHGTCPCGGSLVSCGGVDKVGCRKEKC
jgi:hypothetical protein